MQFNAPLEAYNDDHTAFVLPTDVVQSMGRGTEPNITLKVNGKEFRTDVAVDGDRLVAPLSPAWTKDAGLEVGSSYDIDIELSSFEEEMSIPQDLSEMFLVDLGAKAAWDRLSYDEQRSIGNELAAAEAGTARDEVLAKVRSDLNALFDQLEREA